MSALYVLIHGGDLLDSSMLGPMTKSRVTRAVQYAKQDPEAVLCVTAGISPDFPDMHEPMASLMAKEASLQGSEARLIGPDSDFNSRGELRMFFASIPQTARKAVVSGWWHLPRIRLIIRREWGSATARSIKYISSDDQLTLRLAVLEGLKWVYVFLPERHRSLLGIYKKLFGRASW